MFNKIKNFVFGAVAPVKRYLPFDSGMPASDVASGKDSTVLVDNSTPFDSVNAHLSSLIEAEARAKKVHQDALAAIAVFKKEAQAQLAAQMSAIKQLFPGEEDE